MATNKKDIMILTWETNIYQQLHRQNKVLVHALHKPQEQIL